MPTAVAKWQTQRYSIRFPKMFPLGLQALLHLKALLKSQSCAEMLWVLPRPMHTGLHLMLLVSHMKELVQIPRIGDRSFHRSFHSPFRQCYELAPCCCWVPPVISPLMSGQWSWEGNRETRFAAASKQPFANSIILPLGCEAVSIVQRRKK